MAAAAPAGVAAAFGEGTAEASAGDVADACAGGEGASADRSSDAVAAEASVVVAIREEGEEAPVSVRTLLRLVGLVFAEAVIDDDVVLVDAALHLAAAGEERQGGCG